MQYNNGNKCNEKFAINFIGVSKCRLFTCRAFVSFTQVLQDAASVKSNESQQYVKVPCNTPRCSLSLKPETHLNTLDQGTTEVLT